MARFIPLVLNYRLLLTTLSMAKIEMFQLVLLVATCWAYQRSRWVLAGSVLAVAGMTKPLPLLLILYFVAKREWRIVRSWAAAVGVLLALCAAVMGARDVGWYFVNAAVPVAGDQSMLSWTESQSLMAFTARLFHRGEPVFMMDPAEFQGLPSFTALVLRLAVIGLIGWRVWPQGDRSPQRLAGEWSLALVGMLLVSPLSRDYYAVFLVPAYLWLAHQALCQERWWRWAPAWLGLFSYLLVGQGFPLGIINWLPQLGPWKNNLHVYMYYSIPTWGYLVLLLALGLAQGQRQTATHPETGRLARA
jgi:hypothetical protein